MGAGVVNGLAILVVVESRELVACNGRAVLDSVEARSILGRLASGIACISGAPSSLAPEAALRGWIDEAAPALVGKLS